MNFWNQLTIYPYKCAFGADFSHQMDFRCEKIIKIFKNMNYN